MKLVAVRLYNIIQVSLHDAQIRQVGVHKAAWVCTFCRFNPAFNMASIKQAINEAVERGRCIVNLIDLQWL